MGRRIKKIVLIEPRSMNRHIYSKFPLPRMGLPIIGTILKRAGYDVRFYCEIVHPLDWDDVLSADLVGISTITCTAPRAYAIAKRVRERGIPVVVGGPHPTFLPEEALQFADYVVRGEGEETFPELVKCIEEGERPEGILGVSWKDESGRVHHNPPRPLIPDLDDLPFPDMSILVKGKRPLIVEPFVASRGCPWNCRFCTVTKFFGRKYRFRSPESVVEELKWRKPKKVFFYDDNFVASRRWAMEVAELILKEGLKVKWSTQMRADAARDTELLSTLRRAGLYLVYVGLEAVDPESIREYRKGYEIEKVEESLRRFNEAGVLVHGMFVFGADTDTPDTPVKMAKFALKNKVHTIQISILTPLPGTDLLEEFESQGRLLTKEWSLYDGVHAVFVPKNMTPYELQAKMIEGHRYFYSLKEIAKALLALNFVRARVRGIGRLVVEGFAHANAKFIKCLKVASKAAGRGVEGVKEAWAKVSRKAGFGEKAWTV